MGGRLTAKARLRVLILEDNEDDAQLMVAALAHARGRYLVLLNPDTVIPPTGFAELVRFMDAHTDAGICGPRLLLADGTVQSCGRSFPTVASMLRQMQSVDRIFRWFERPADGAYMKARLIGRH